jgi:hypothetical protein
MGIYGVGVVRQTTGQLIERAALVAYRPDRAVRGDDRTVQGLTDG